MNIKLRWLHRTYLSMLLPSLVLLVAPRPSIARNPPTTRSAATIFNDAAIAVTNQLNDNDPVVVSHGTADIRQLLVSDPQRTSNALRRAWLKRLTTLERYDDILDLTLRASLAEPADTIALEQFQSIRVQSYLASGNAPQALAAAKQLFCVSTLQGTADAISAVSQCLDALHPDDRDLLREYRQEQTEGASLASSASPLAHLILGDVQIDPAPYAQTIDALSEEDYETLVGRGNLLLLCGNAKEAWSVFQRAYMLAPDRDLASASENLARSIKAQDGVIGRANAWVLSMRPKLAALDIEHPEPSAASSAQTSRKE